MGTIQVKDREFEVFLKEEDIQKEIKRVAADINRDYVGKEPLFLCILNGSFMFAADLLKNVSVPCNVSFVKVSSYQGTDTTGKVKELMGLQEDVEGRHIIIVEDIVDTGYTMRDILDSLKDKKAASVEVCALLCKVFNSLLPFNGTFYLCCHKCLIISLIGLSRYICIYGYFRFFQLHALKILRKSVRSAVHKR